MSFGNILKKIRQEKNLTQEELAKKIDTSRSNIANYENDKNMPSIEILEKLSNVLSCSVDYLLGKSDIRNLEHKSNFNSDMIKIGLSTKEYKEPTAEQKKQIEDFAKFVLKDNKKKENK